MTGMGKLHTLKRAVQRNPRAFLVDVPRLEQTGTGEPRFTGMLLFCSGASLHAGQWKPATVGDRQTRFPYRHFVRSALLELGYGIPI